MTRSNTARTFIGGVFAFWVVNTLVVNLALRVTGGITTLHHTRDFVLGRAKADSWGPMREALASVWAGGTSSMYGAMLSDHGVDETPFVYPPTSLLFVQPFGRLSADGLPSIDLLNALGWLAVAGTTAVVAWLLVVRTKEAGVDPTGLTPRSITLLAAAGALSTLTFYPVVKAFALGQTQTWVTFAFASATLGWVGGRIRLCGALCGFMCLVKPQFGLLLLWALLRRRWPFVQGWCTVVVPGGVLSVLIYGLASHIEYVRAASLLAKTSWAYEANQSVNGLLQRALFNAANLEWDPQPAPFNVLVYAGTIASAVALVGTALFWKPPRHDSGLLDFLVAGLSVTMAAPVVWEHHYGQLMPIYACVLPAAVAVWPVKRAPLLTLMLSFVLTSNLYQIVGRTASTHMNFLQSYVLFGGVVLLVHLYALRARVERAER